MVAEFWHPSAPRAQRARLIGRGSRLMRCCVEDEGFVALRRRPGTHLTQIPHDRQTHQGLPAFTDPARSSLETIDPRKTRNHFRRQHQPDCRKNPLVRGLERLKGPQRTLGIFITEMPPATRQFLHLMRPANTHGGGRQAGRVAGWRQASLRLARAGTAASAAVTVAPACRGGSWPISLLASARIAVTLARPTQIAERCGGGLCG
jgi:hypothetical protein